MSKQLMVVVDIDGNVLNECNVLKPSAHNQYDVVTVHLDEHIDARILDTENLKCVKTGAYLEYEGAQASVDIFAYADYYWTPARYVDRLF
jgi:hypothetical protein